MLSVHSSSEPLKRHKQVYSIDVYMIIMISPYQSSPGYDMKLSTLSKIFIPYLLCIHKEPLKTASQACIRESEGIRWASETIRCFSNLFLQLHLESFDQTSIGNLIRAPVGVQMSLIFLNWRILDHLVPIASYGCPKVSQNVLNQS